MSMPLVALIVDDHAMVREGLRRALEAEQRFQIYEASSINEARAQIARINPSLLILDINLPDGNGLEIASWVRSLSATVAIVILSLNERDEFVIAAMKSGATAYVNKSAPLADFLAAVNHALQSPGTFSARELAGVLNRKTITFNLSQRELQILTTLHLGQPLKELAASLFISESTLKTHLNTIYRKMEVRNRTQAVRKAQQSGLSE
jgi:DNA-binding NarL/FixJ family response regulator